MNNLFSIGELAKYQHVSKQTLIFYDKIGLFRPAFVDPSNGYRYYSAKQIDYLDTILIMKKIGFSLEEIRMHMQDYTIDSSLIALRKQLSVLDSRIQELSLIRSRLASRCEQMEDAKSCLRKEIPAGVEKVNARRILLHPVEAPYTLRETSIATKECFAEAFEKQLPVFFQCGVCVPLERIRKGHCTEASFAFLPIEKTEQSENIKELPSGTCASIYHVGDYQSIGRSYRKLLSYCEENALEIVSDSYEFCINDYITSGDEKEDITKILFYVRGAKG